MDNNPKVSFIPKSSLVREESFMARKRPRSILGFLGNFSLILVLGSYATVYLYGISLSNDIKSRTDEIQSAQKAFEQAPEIAKAKIFRARADVALELLNGHIVVSPIFDFLSKNTLQDIEYSSFELTRDEKGLHAVLNGEAVDYKTLAYQADVLRQKNAEITDLSINHIVLTDYGSVKFDVTLYFSKDFLSYSKTLNAINTVVNTAGVASSTTATTETLLFVPPGSVVPGKFMQATSSSLIATTSSHGVAHIATTTIFVGTGSAASTSVPLSQTPGPSDASMVATNVVTQEKAAPATIKTSFWSRFKFW